MKLLMRYSLEEFICHCGLEEEVILRYVSNSWISPVDLEKMIFDEEDLARAQLICELQQLMGVNDEGVPIILHLIDQLNLIHLETKGRHQDENKKMPST